MIFVALILGIIAGSIAGTFFPVPGMPDFSYIIYSGIFFYIFSNLLLLSRDYENDEAFKEQFTTKIIELINEGKNICQADVYFDRIIIIYGDKYTTYLYKNGKLRNKTRVDSIAKITEEVLNENLERNFKSTLDYESSVYRWCICGYN